MTRVISSLLLISLAAFLTNSRLSAAKNESQMKSLGAVDIGDATVISKYKDLDDGVICYVITPKFMKTNEVAEYGTGHRKTYEGNNAGSISCVKAK